ncbi:MAG: amidase family protein, partial [Nitriliruptoraceae bacterium]
VEYAQSMEWMRRWRRQLAKLFRTVDIVVSPTTPLVTPLVHGTEMIGTTHRLTEKTYAWSMGGNPAVSVPVGFADGLPVGMQLAGAWWRDGMLLRTATAYQSVTDWHSRRPAFNI